MKLCGYKTVLSICAVGAAFLLTDVGASFAQSDYPSAFQRRAGHGSYGQFDLRGGESQKIVDVDESVSYRVCIVGKNATVIVDGSDEQRPRPRRLLRCPGQEHRHSKRTGRR